MITPRTTRLVRTADLAGFRDALVALACDGTPLDARDRLVIVPTRAAAAHLTRTIEDRRLDSATAIVLPDLITPPDLVTALAGRIALDRPLLSPAEREVLLGVAARAARANGIEPPFRLRPALVAEILRFYDTLRRFEKDVDTFERLALGLLEPGAIEDRGAARLVAQTRFLVAAFRQFERRTAEVGVDEHGIRARLLAAAADRPFRHVVIAVGDRASDAYGLYPVDWDLLARVPGLLRLDVVVTDAVLAGAFHERLRTLLPGAEEVRLDVRSGNTPTLVTTADSLVHRARDREEEVGAFARRVKHAFRHDALGALDRVALVVRQPLPYVYVAREVLRSAGVPCQMFDALPLAAEPFAAAVDLLVAFVDSGFARTAAVALLRCPHFRFGKRDGVAPADVSALDRALSEGGYLGELAALEALIAKWRDANPSHGHLVRAIRAGDVVCELARALEPLRAPQPAALHLATVIEFLGVYEPASDGDDPLRERQQRTRGAIAGMLRALRGAYERFDQTPVAFDEIGALVRRWIEAHTFAPRVGDAGVHLVDAVSARFGDFDWVQLAGLVDGEWPDRSRRSIFYSTSVLRELGWPAEADRADAERAAFRDLLRLPASRLVVSTFSLEADALVSPSPFVDELASANLDTLDQPLPPARIFEDEALALTPAQIAHLDDETRVWAAWRLDARVRTVVVPGTTQTLDARAWSLSALERYQDCPFKFFASDVLRLEEAAEDESTLTPRARGRFIHELFERFFTEWDRRGGGAIGSDRIDEARELFRDVADPLLARMPQADAALERARLFGSAIAVGLVDVVLGIEASRPVDVVERWLEYRLEGEFSLGGGDRASVALRGVADRIDLLAGRRLRVVDYKSGSAPNPKRALQVPIYALCAQERLTARDGAPWTVDDATYIAFTGKRTIVPIVKAGADGERALADARARVDGVLAGIAAGEFPPRPHDDVICRWCAYPTVCRKDYVEDD